MGNGEDVDDLFGVHFSFYIALLSHTIHIMLNPF